MIKRGTETTHIDSPRLGKGRMKMNTIISDKDQVEGLSLFATLELDIDSEIGYHQHINEAEAYFIVSGTGEFTGNDGFKKQVSSGDLCLIEKGQSHGLKNIGNQPLSFIAIVYNSEK